MRIKFNSDMDFFDKEILNDIQELESSTIITQNILNNDELEKLINFERNATERFAVRDDARKTGLGINGKTEVDPKKWDPIIKDILLNKIEKLIGDFSIDDDEYYPHFFRSTFPVSIHADTGHDKKSLIYKQLLFSLESSPPKIAKTLIFKNKWYGPAASFIPKNSQKNDFQYSLLDDNGKFIVIDDVKQFLDEIKTSTSNIIEKNNGVFTISGKLIEKIEQLANSRRYNIWTDEHITSEIPFDKEMYTKYLSHIPYETLYGLDIETIFDWQPGSVLIWNRTNLHSSNNFLKDGVKNKLGLALFTKRK